jgi:PAS domain S-box-containing protein
MKNKKESAMSSVLSLFANAGDGVFAIDQEQRIFYWSKFAAHSLGYSSNEAIGQYCWKLIDGKSSGGYQICRENCPIIQNIRKNIPVEPFNLWVRHQDGGTIRINISSIGMIDSNDEIIGLIHIQRKA